MNAENKTGIQISRKQELSIVGGGIQIQASEKPLAASFSTTPYGYVYLLLDTSGSMKGRKLDQARAGIIDFARDAFKKEYRVGLIRFSDIAEVIFEPTNDLEIVQNSVKTLKGVGATRLTEAIKMAQAKLEGLTGARGGGRYIVVATDGQPYSVKTSLEAAEQAKAAGIEIITIGTEGADKKFLQKLASRTELAASVTSEQFAQAIFDASRLLASPGPNRPK